MTTATQKIPAGYKQTEIGVIPADWDIKELKDLVSKVIDNRGKTPPYSNNPDVELIETASISFVTKYPNYSKVTKFVSEKTYSNWFRGHPIKDDVLVSTVGEYSGSSAIMEENRGTIAQNLIALRIKGVNPTYAFYWTRSANFKEQLDRVMMSQAQPSLRVPWLLNFYLNIPRPEEQTAIATAFSDADALIEKLEKLTEKKKNIKQGAMQELLTGKRRLPGFSGKWETKKLGEVAEFDRGRDLPKSVLNEDGPYKCIHYGQLFSKYKELISEIKSRTHSDTARFYSKTNDVLMPTSDVTPRGLATASCIKENGVILGGGILVIRLHSGYDGLYLSYVVSQNKNSVLRFVKGSTVFHLYANDIANFEISFPELKEQVAIASVLSDMDIEIEKLESQLTKYQNLKQGMMQSLLTGKIRLLAK